MAVELLARGVEGIHQTALPLSEKQVVRLGRNPQSGWQVGWDRLISREHADIRWEGDFLHIQCLEKATNPLVANGQPHRQLVLRVGEKFQIGQTVFELVQKQAPPIDDGATLQMELRYDENSEDLIAYESGELNGFEFSDPVRQMEIVAKLPDLIGGSTSDVNLAATLVELLLDSIPAAIATAVVHYENFDKASFDSASASGFDPGKPSMMKVATRDDFEGRFRPSRRMISQALQTGHSVLHIWDQSENNGQFTISGDLDWAFCTPIKTGGSNGWCLYVSGAGSPDGGLMMSEDSLKGDLRFAELVAQFIGSIRQVRTLEEQKTQLGSFFSPKVMEGLLTHKANAMKPSQQDISVLFCDVRGFSRKSEALQDDLFKLLSSVKGALSVMTGGILEYDGAIADFQGDAALGFWGWPMPLEEGPVPACRAALSIVRGFLAAQTGDGLLDGFSVGVGICHGQAIAGEIGTTRQAKIGVFGPVVNQGSRLEGLTRQFGVSICIDEATAMFAQKYIPQSEAITRRLARICPAGMDTAMNVWELLPAGSWDGGVSPQFLFDYDKALNAVIDGNWTEALRFLSEYKDTDGPVQFLLKQMERHNNQPPENWDGAFRLTSK